MHTDGGMGAHLGGYQAATAAEEARKQADILARAAENQKQSQERTGTRDKRAVAVQYPPKLLA